MYENFAAAFFAALPFSLCYFYTRREGGGFARQEGREGGRWGDWRVARGESGFVTYYFGAGFI